MKYNGLLFFFLILTQLILIGCSCNNEPKTYSQWDMWNMAVDFDPKIELVGVSNHEADRRIICSNYGANCISGTGKRILVRKVELIVIMFADEKSAKAEARRLGQWYSKNWLLDDVSNEPVLESFVQEAFKAKPGLDPNEIKSK